MTIPEFMLQHLPLIILIVLGVSIFLFIWAYLPIPWGAPWVPSSFGTTLKMLKMAKIKPDELVIDLGAGDGRSVILAAKVHRARAIGVEIDPLRCGLANLFIFLLGLRKNAHVYYGNLFAFDVSEANVVLLYLLQGTNQRLKEKLVQELRPGTRVVSHSFSISGWAPIALDDRRGIFLYEIGNTGSEVWTRFV